MLPPETVSQVDTQTASQENRVYVELEEYMPYVYAMVRRKVGDVPDWEDVVQEVYVSCFDAIEKNGYSGRSSVKTWLYTIVQRRIYDFMRLRYRDIEHWAYQTKAQFTDSITPAQRYEERDQKAFLLSGFVVLSFRERQIFKLLLDDWNMKDIASFLQVTYRYVHLCYKRGLQKMRHYFTVLIREYNG